jgi:hypothetical protein
MPETTVAQPQGTPPAQTTAGAQPLKTESVAQPQSVEGEGKPSPETKEDLITRASKVNLTPASKKDDTNPFGLTKEDYDKVQADPTLSKFYKSMQADYVRKTQEAAELKRQAEDKSKQLSNWTPERVQQLLNDQQFVQAAQQVAQSQNPKGSGLTDQEYSALTDSEKAQLSSMQQQLQQMQQQNWQMQQKAQDEHLKAKYANYAPDIVDTTVNQLVRGEVKANREYVWKAIDYDDAVRRAYELGKQDRLMETTEKQQATSLTGFQATPQSNITPTTGESNRDYWKRVAQQRLNEAKGRNQ